LAVIILLRCLWLWQPERQLLLHQAHFRQAIEARNWSKLGKLIDPAYADRWGYTHETGLREAQRWLGQFFSLTITSAGQTDTLSPTGGTVTERWQMDGKGLEAASLIVEHVNACEAPFVFQWKHGSWKPWDWTLVRIDNTALDLTAPDM
jgi:hypothetical protein